MFLLMTVKKERMLINTCLGYCMGRKWTVLLQWFFIGYWILKRGWISIRALFFYMNDKHLKGLSKVLSLVLRHKPEVIGITLDQNGWTDVHSLLEKMNTAGFPISPGQLQQIVATNNKQRFGFNADQSRIRARQGHSVQVDPGFQPTIPPARLYHGTALQNLESIRSQGLHSGSRNHVHLSDNAVTAMQVGARHGKPVLLEVDAGPMHAAGFDFYISDNGVWLTDSVPRTYLIFPQ